MVTLYGLSNCDTCKKARNWHRAQPVPAAMLKAWAADVGGWDKLVNRSSTTWRNLLPQRKDPRSDPEWTLLLREYPALVRRPVVVREGHPVTVGFSDNGFKTLFAASA
jgi:Spx/MgsR family transcriptional regulator